jgi:enterobactin synthetase component D
MRHGLLGAFHLPVEPGSIPTEVLDRLHPQERALAEEMKGYRQVQWIGGRLAARETAKRLGLGLGPLETDPFGAPKAPPSLAISIAHKKHLAVALVARRKHGALGVDLELTSPSRLDIAPKVLTERELTQVDELEAHRRWTSVLIRFSIKEAIYKALAPRLKRYIAFEEAEVQPKTDGSADIRLQLSEAPSPAQLDAEYVWIDDSLVTTVRVRWD